MGCQNYTNKFQRVQTPPKLGKSPTCKYFHTGDQKSKSEEKNKFNLPSVITIRGLKVIILFDFLKCEVYLEYSNQKENVFEENPLPINSAEERLYTYLL